MLVLRLVLIAGLLIVGASLAWKITPSRSKLLVLRDEPHFPVVSGFNLDRQEFEFPRDFGGETNLVIVPFQRNHQQIVNTWIPFAQEVEASFPRFIYYELPTIYEMPAISRTFLNEGMRAGIPDQTARERTITLYLNKETFKTALGITNEDDIYLFLVDRSGEIVWSSSGAYTVEKAESLLEFIQGQRSGSSNIGFKGS